MESDVFHSQAVAVEDNDYLKTTTKTVTKINVPRSKINRATSRPTVNNVQEVQQDEVQSQHGDTTHLRQDKKTLAKAKDKDSRNNCTKMISNGWLQAHQYTPLILSYAIERAGSPVTERTDKRVQYDEDQRHSC